MERKDLNRLKLVLVEKRKTGVWLAEQLGVTSHIIFDDYDSGSPGA